MPLQRSPIITRSRRTRSEERAQPDGNIAEGEVSNTGVPIQPTNQLDRAQIPHIQANSILDHPIPTTSQVPSNTALLRTIEPLAITNQIPVSNDSTSSINSVPISRNQHSSTNLSYSSRDLSTLLQPEAQLVPSFAHLNFITPIVPNVSQIVPQATPITSTHVVSPLTQSVPSTINSNSFIPTLSNMYQATPQRQLSSIMPTQFIPQVLNSLQPTNTTNGIQINQVPSTIGHSQSTIIPTQNLPSTSTLHPFQSSSNTSSLNVNQLIPSAGTSSRTQYCLNALSSTNPTQIVSSDSTIPQLQSTSNISSINTAEPLQPETSQPQIHTNSTITTQSTANNTSESQNQRQYRNFATTSNLPNQLNTNHEHVSNQSVLPGQLLNVPTLYESYQETLPQPNNFPRQSYHSTGVELPNLQYNYFNPSTHQTNCCDNGHTNIGNQYYRTPNESYNPYFDPSNYQAFLHGQQTNQAEPQTLSNITGCYGNSNYNFFGNLNGSFPNTLTSNNPYNYETYPNLLNPQQQWSNSFSNLNLPVNQTEYNAPHHKKLYDLPEFDGNPENWPIFISQYIVSTIEYQYSNLQNATRLIKALTGKAKAHGKSLLVNPKNVNLVLQQLEFLYGRPEIILDYQIKEIEKLENITETTLELLIPMSIKIQNLNSFLETVPNNIIYFCNPTLIKSIISKLPPSKKDQWIRFALNIRPFYTLRDLSFWISREAQYVSLVNLHNESSFPQKKRVLTVNRNNNESNQSKLCRCCKLESHLLVRCPEFKKCSIQKRWEKVKELNLCYSCLRSGHRTTDCCNKRICDIDGCKSYHNRYLHKDISSNNSNNVVCNISSEEILMEEIERLQNNPTCNENHIVNCALTDGEVLYKILPIKLYGTNKSMEVLAFIDEGANVTLIDREIMNALGYNKNHIRNINMTIKWFGETTLTEKSDIVSLGISGLNNYDKILTIDEVRTTNNLDLPTQALDTSKLADCYNKLKELNLKYPSKKPKILIGLDNSSICFSKKSFEVEGLIASETKLGWVIYGKTTTNLNCNIAEVIEDDSNSELHRMVDDYINSDILDIKSNQCISEAEDKAIETLKRTTKKITNENRFETGLLWVSDDIQLPDNFQTAYNRLLFIERKMKKNPEFADKYEKNIMLYIEKNYARKLSLEETLLYPNKRWYLPHFVSLNPHKPSKFRIVFDASSKHEGVSLNSVLLSGPDLNQPLIKILLNFRIGKYGVCGDIQEMFNQIKIIEKDQHCQRFLWRHGDPKNPLDTYVMTSMTFGASCSPCSAQFVKNENARLFQKSNPVASAAIENCHNVDDFVMSFSSEEEAIDITNQVKEIHNKGGFVLRKFVSNSEKILNAIGSKNENETPHVMDKSLNSTEKILGLRWDFKSDSFIFESKLKTIDNLLLEGHHPTKREVLRIIMSIYDPFGFLNNFIINGRLILQEIWKSSIGWDSRIPNYLLPNWTNWISDLSKLNTIKIPRTILDEHYINLELHTFTDSSDKAFSAVSYLRSFDEDGHILVSFIMSKTKLSPIKKMHSIPRLELQGAVLGVKLKSFISENLKLNINKFYFWCDSKVVLSWISSNHNRYKPFVAHRISTIHSLSNMNEWNWIPSKENIADEGSKFSRNCKINWESPWLTGPRFLNEPNENWETERDFTIPNFEQMKEAEIKPQLLINTINTKNSYQIIDPRRFSSFWKIKRVVAWVFRARKILLKKNQFEDILTLSYEELCVAERFLIKLAQNDGFFQEIYNIEINEPVQKSSSIKELCPFLDQHKILRAGGRLQQSWFLPYKRRNPILLPKKHVITNLIIQEYHETNFHVFTKTTMNNIQMKFWIPSLRQALRSVEYKCSYCKKMRAQNIQPIMAELPIERQMPYIRPFSYSGIDFCGPFTVKNEKRTIKCWILLITCMTTRAIHLEIVEKLNADNVLLRLNDFINRRGIPTRIRSDCASYFKSTKKRLHEILNSPKVLDKMTKQNIEWVHNCPGTPHAGGAWERLIKSVKRILEHSLRELTPTIDTFRSFTINAENIINNRPLTELSHNINDEEPITPNHFLLGSSNNWQTPITDKKINLRKQLNIFKAMKRTFWKKWVNEYIHIHNKRPKWFQEKTFDLCPDKFVFVEHQGKWVKGIITKVVPNKDQKLRFLEIKTPTGILKKHASNILFPNFEEAGEC